MSTDLTGQKVLVIGGSKYLGEAVARAAADTGARVVIGARDLDKACAVAEDLHGSAVHLDVTDEDSIATAAAKLGSVDHIVITASAHHNVPVAEMETDRIIGALEAKIVAPLLVAKHFAATMSATGSIVLFSGLAAWQPSVPYTIMGVSNGAVSFLAQHLANELAPIRVNAISPGIVDSGTHDGLGEQGKQQMLAGAAQATLIGRTGTNQDIADAAVWLLGAGFVTGETIHVEGGAQHK